MERVTEEDYANVFGSFMETALNCTEQMNNELEEKNKEVKELSETLQKIKEIINNEKITGIEAKLMIKDILEENNVVF